MRWWVVLSKANIDAMSGAEKTELKSRVWTRRQCGAVDKGEAPGIRQQGRYNREGWRENEGADNDGSSGRKDDGHDG